MLLFILAFVQPDCFSGVYSKFGRVPVFERNLWTGAEYSEDGRPSDHPADSVKALEEYVSWVVRNKPKRDSRFSRNIVNTTLIAHHIAHADSPYDHEMAMHSKKISTSKQIPDAE